ncbi:MAG TPA: glycosyltransferase [Balneolales bacterium]|nr:glycosyltransferase [Balneolales bacterium]
MPIKLNPNHKLTPDVSIIIVNYKSMNLIYDCISSIQKHSNNQSYEIIVVSNSIWNTDDLKVMDKYPDVRWFNPKNNAGFAAANNIGAEQANGKYLFFLNPDTLFHNDVIGTLLEASEQYPDAGIIGPYTLNSDLTHQPSVKNEFGLDHMLILAFPFLKILFSNKTFGHIPVKSTRYVEVVNGSALFMPHKLFDEIGGMNESYFMYWEENDLCKSVISMGKKILFYDNTKIIHLGGQTTGDVFIPMEIEKHRSQKQYLKKFAPQYVSLNRILGSIAYLWRFIGAIILLNKRKISQFGTLFYWYTFKYDQH